MPPWVCTRCICLPVCVGRSATRARRLPRASLTRFTVGRYCNQGVRSWLWREREAYRRQGDLFFPFHCWAGKRLIITCFTVGHEEGAQSPLTTRFTVGQEQEQALPTTRFTVGLEQGREPNHPFHCWARAGGGYPPPHTRVPPTMVYRPPRTIYTPPGNSLVNNRCSTTISSTRGC